MIEFATLHDQVINFQFSCSPFHDLLLNRAFSDKSVDNYVSLLADSMSSVNSLQVHLRIPVRVEYYDYISLVKIDSNATSSGR